VTKTLRIDLPILLPGAPDARDACVQRLVAFATTVPGVDRAHIDHGMEDAGAAETTVTTGAPAGGGATEAGPQLCIHYDPARVTMSHLEAQVRAAGAGITARYGHALLHFDTVDSEDARLRIEDGILKEPGVLTASVNTAGQVARIEFDRRLTSEDRVARGLRRLLGIGRAAPTPASPTPRPTWYARNTRLAWSLAAGVVLAATWMLERWAGLPHVAAIGLYLVSYAFGAFDLVSHTIKKLWRGKFTFDIDLLMLLAAVGAAAIGAWAEGAFLLFLFSLAHALEHYALGRARDAIKALADLAPPMARVLRHGTEHEVPVADVAVGEIVIVRPGDRIAVDGKVRSGRSAVDQAPITGESVPVDKEPGAEVFAGTVNGEGALEVETTRAAGDRTLDRVVRLVTEAQTLKAPTQLFTERFERIFVPITLAASALLLVVPSLLGVWTWSLSFYRAMTLLVAASPCAVAIGTPATVLAGIAQAARRGVLIKGGAHLENLGTIQAIAFDKTGTLTIGKPEVTDLRPAEGVGQSELLRVSGAVERRSQHPLAAAIVRRAQASGIELPEAGELQSVTAKGVRSQVEGKVVEIGSLRLWEGQGAIPAPITADVAALQEAGRSIVVVRHGERWLGVIGVADQARPGARGVLDRLRGLGIRRIVMLTGDNRGVGEAVGREVGVDEVRAGLLPEDKVAAIREMVGTHGSVAMVGDGVNDAPALANATVGIAMGGAGTAVALETADAALMGDDLSRLPFALALSRRVRSIIRQNLFIAMGVIALLVTASIGGWTGIGVTVVVHEGSTLVVLANALRLLAFRGPTGAGSA
jgi:Cd2+/Zn2+-exporting ATPase